MSNFERTSFDSSQSLDDEPGPLPLTAELLDSLLGYIKDLWAQYELLKRTPDWELRGKLSQEIYRAYTELDASVPAIGQLDLASELKEAADFELWFSCHHLRKVLK
jgi:hypothetical protein